MKAETMVTLQFGKHIFTINCDFWHNKLQTYCLLIIRDVVVNWVELRDVEYAHEE